MNWLSKQLKIYNNGLLYPEIVAQNTQLVAALLESNNKVVTLEYEIRDLEENLKTLIKKEEEINILDYKESYQKAFTQKPFKYPFTGEGVAIDIKKSLYVKDSTLVKEYANKIISEYNPEY